MIRIELAELESDQPCDLTRAQGLLLAGSGVVACHPSPSEPGTWLVSASGKVGAARAGDVEISIRPKVRIDRLLFLAGYAVNPAGWRDEQVPLPEADDLVPAVAHALWRQAERALRPGLLQGYRELDEASPVLRGRFRETAQLQRRHGLPFPLEVRYDEFSTDIAENRILRTAIARMLHVPRVDGGSARMLRHLLRKLSGVTPLAAGRPLPRWLPTRLNARYHAALRLAELVLRATSIEHGAGGAPAAGFLLDMPQIFEDFVTVALAEQLHREHGGSARRQDPHHLDEARLIGLVPDLVWRVAGRPAAVADAKYKAEKPHGYPNADLYQMLAYCTVLGLRRGHLIYARGNEEASRHTVRESGIEIICHALDLDAPPDALLGQVAQVASALTPASLAS